MSGGPPSVVAESAELCEVCHGSDLALHGEHNIPH